MKGSRVVHQADALEWLKANSLENCSVITSMPDFTEFPSLTIAQWKEWFVEAARLIISRCPPNGVAIFYQRDSKHEGQWIDKGYLCAKAAEVAGVELLWHKIICRAPVGFVTFGKPAYSHLLCFSKEVRIPLGMATADVVPQAGKTTWTRGMGVNACRVACEFILEHTKTRTIVDPFCGHGTVLAVANEMGLDAVGVELRRKRAERARGLEVPR